MNPPFEEKYGCMKIVTNVLDSVPAGTKCAFILPDKKLEKHGGKKLLKKHSLEKIIKLPEKTFNEGVEKAREFDPFGHAGFDPSGVIRLTP